MYIDRKIGPMSAKNSPTPGVKLPKLSQSPAAYCPACIREHRAGDTTNPRRRSHRIDGLCSKHAPANATAIAPPRKRCATKQPGVRLPNCHEILLPTVLRVYANTGQATSQTPGYRSRRADGLCRAHARPKAKSIAPPLKRLACKQLGVELPKLSRQPSAYCPECLRECRVSKHNSLTYRSHLPTGLCTQHAAVSETRTRKRAAPSSERTPRKRIRVQGKQPVHCVHKQARRKCAEAGWTQSARVGPLCTAHHAQRLSGLRGSGVARYALDDRIRTT